MRNWNILTYWDIMGFQSFHWHTIEKLIGPIGIHMGFHIDSIYDFTDVGFDIDIYGFHIDSYDFTDVGFDIDIYGFHIDSYGFH